MRTKILPLVAAAVFIAPPLPAAEPNEIRDARVDYEKACEQASKPLRVRYLAELARLKETQVKAGKLEDALAVEAEIKLTTAEGAVEGEKLRRIVLKGKFDLDTLKVQAGGIWIEHGPYNYPENLSINGVPWKPKWTGKTSEKFDGLKAPLASFENATVEIKQAKGRSDISKEITKPTAENAQTLTVKIIDSPNGADDYEIRITW